MHVLQGAGKGLGGSARPGTREQHLGQELNGKYDLPLVQRKECVGSDGLSNSAIGAPSTSRSSSPQVQGKTHGCPGTSTTVPGPQVAWRSRLRSSVRAPPGAALAPPSSRLQLRPSAPRANGGRTEFPSAGAPASPQFFLFTERKGKWKRRGGGGWRPLRRPWAGSDAVSQGPTKVAWARSSAPVRKKLCALGPVALAPASATSGPRGPGAPGSRGLATRCAPGRRGTEAGALGLRGRAEGAGNPEFGGSGLSF